MVMNEIDKLALMASLSEEHCELNHGPETSHLFTPAIDYLIQPFGYTVSDVEEVSVRDMIVPICAECAKALQGNEWTLFYCFECNSSHWIYRKHARLRYRYNVLWLRGCPECTKEFGGLYFSDFKGLPEETYFLSQQAVKKIV
ncbi:TPA: hypothetical protein DCP88_02520 [Candidatus Campbellbacteria bacterium]|nr:hypothetical protein [Candidatus Campbellbacteria bacterium]HAQ01680.1 hypothetical protein [Candidatus Campbellbacteria bacterium]